MFTSLCVLAGSTGIVSSTVASNVLSARPTSCQTRTHTCEVHLCKIHIKICLDSYNRPNLELLLSFLNVSYLDHWDVLLWSCRLNPVGHLNHSFNQPGHILINLVIWTIQVGGGRRADLLRLQLEQWKESRVRTGNCFFVNVMYRGLVMFLHCCEGQHRDFVT